MTQFLGRLLVFDSIGVLRRVGSLVAARLLLKAYLVLVVKSLFNIGCVLYIVMLTVFCFFFYFSRKLNAKSDIKVFNEITDCQKPTCLTGSALVI